MKGGVLQNLGCRLLFGMAVALLFQSASAESAQQEEKSAVQKKPVSQRARKGYHMDPAPIVEQPNNWTEWKTLMKIRLSSRFLEFTKKSVDAEMLELQNPEKLKCKISFWISRDQGIVLSQSSIKVEAPLENSEIQGHIHMFLLSFPKTLTRFPKGSIEENWVKCSATLVGNEGATEFSAKPTTIGPPMSLNLVAPPRKVRVPPDIIAPGTFDP